MRFLKDEVKLDTLTDSVVLTNQRIVRDHGDKCKDFIFLEKISSIEMHYKNNLLLLIVGVIIFFTGIIFAAISHIPELGWFFLILGLGCIIAFIVTRHHVIIVSPDGGKSFKFEVSGVSSDRIDEFLTNVQAAKLDK